MLFCYVPVLCVSGARQGPRFYQMASFYYECQIYGTTIIESMYASMTILCKDADQF